MLCSCYGRILGFPKFVSFLCIFPLKCLLSCTFFFGSILEWGDIKKGAITSQSKEYGSSTWMVIQLGCYREMTLVVKILSLLMAQSEEGIKNNLEVLPWKTVWEVVPCIKILKNGRKCDLGRETKCSVLNKLSLECVQVLPVMQKNIFFGLWSKSLYLRY